MPGMDLKTYLKSLPDDDAREVFALSCDTTFGHMRNCMYPKGKQLSPASSVLVERLSGRRVMRWDLRPDDWHRIWPELIGKKGAPAVPKSEAV